MISSGAIELRDKFPDFAICRVLGVVSREARRSCGVAPFGSCLLLDKRADLDKSGSFREADVRRDLVECIDSAGVRSSTSTSEANDTSLPSVASSSGAYSSLAHDWVRSGPFARVRRAMLCSGVA